MQLVNNKNANVAKTAIARELACFIRGMMTDNIAQVIKVHAMLVANRRSLSIELTGSVSQSHSLCSCSAGLRRGRHRSAVLLGQTR